METEFKFSLTKSVVRMAQNQLCTQAPVSLTPISRGKVELNLVCSPTGFRGSALPKPSWDSHFSIPNICLCPCPGTDTRFELVIIL